MFLVTVFKSCGLHSWTFIIDKVTTLTYLVPILYITQQSVIDVDHIKNIDGIILKSNTEMRYWLVLEYQLFIFQALSLILFLALAYVLKFRSIWN